jgi:hypothetical protein
MRPRSNPNIIGLLKRADAHQDRAIKRLQNDRSVPDWIAVDSLSNGWSSDTPPVGFWRSNAGIVYVQGVITGGVTGALFTLPAGFRPGSQKRIPVVANGAFGFVTVGTDGVVTVSAGSATYTDLSNVSFRAE